MFDKFMQYQIVDPPDVVAWTFTNGVELGEEQVDGRGRPKNLSGFEFSVLRVALDKANGRVLLAKKKVVALRKEDDDTRAEMKARDENMEVDAETRGAFFLFLCERILINAFWSSRTGEHYRQSGADNLLEGLHEPYQGTKNCFGKSIGWFHLVSCTSRRNPACEPLCSYGHQRGSMEYSCWLGTRRMGRMGNLGLVSTFLQTCELDFICSEGSSFLY